MLGLKLNHVSKRGHRWSGTSGRRWAYSAHPSSQIQWERGRTDSCKFSFTDQTISEWSKLSAELAESGSLNIFRSRLAANLVCRPTGAMSIVPHQLSPRSRSRTRGEDTNTRYLCVHTTRDEADTSATPTPPPPHHLPHLHPPHHLPHLHPPPTSLTPTEPHTPTSTPTPTTPPHLPPKPPISPPPPPPPPPPPLRRIFSIMLMLKVIEGFLAFNVFIFE